MGERPIERDDIREFLPAKQIEADRRIAILESERRTCEEINTVRDDVAGVKRQVESLQEDVQALQSGQADIKTTLDGMAVSLSQLKVSLDDVSHETEIIKTENADGVQITKTIRVMGNVWGFAQKPISWVIALLTWFGYNWCSAMFREHGITFLWLVSGGKTH